MPKTYLLAVAGALAAILTPAVASAQPGYAHAGYHRDHGGHGRWEHRRRAHERWEHRRRAEHHRGYRHR